MGKKNKNIYPGNLTLRGRVFTAVTGGCFAIAAIIGIIGRTTYTDITSEEDPMQYFEVAPFMDELIETVNSESYLEIFDDCKYVLKVRAASGVEFMFEGTKQEAVVEQVFRGDGVSRGDSITVIRTGWYLSQREDGTYELGMGFCNFMEEGEEYLIYFEDKVDTLDPKENAFCIVGTITNPLFSYADHDNIILGDQRYVPYESVKNNEFFARTETGLQTLENWKEKMMEPWR